MQNAECRIRTGRLGMAMFVFAAALAGTADAAPLNVVATTSSMGMLARVVGGDGVRVTVLAPPDRDAHYLLAKPSMLVALRALVGVGVDGAHLVRQPAREGRDPAPLPRFGR